MRCDAPENLKAYGKTLDYETNAFFAGYVYLLLAFIIGLILAYYGVVAAIGWTVESVVHDQVHGRGGGKRRFNLMVVPGLASEDRRAGFENFSRFLTFLMGATLVNYFALYFMRLQNLYMRNHDYSSLPEFMFRDIVDPVEKLFSSIKNAGELDTEFVAEAAGDYTGLGDLVNILDPGMNDSQAYLGIFVLLIVYAVVSIVFFSATSDLARQARNNLRRLLSEPNGEDKAKRYYGANGTDVSARLEAMSIWPVAWPNLRNLLRYLGIGIAFLIFYRIWMIWLASILLRFLKSGNISDEPKETAKAKA